MKDPIRAWVKERMGPFLGRQLVHVIVTLIVLGLLLAGARQAGALESVLSIPQTTSSAQTGYSSRSYTFTYQGRLSDRDGVPIDNESPGVDMAFSLYITDTAGSPIWSETHLNVPISQGLFSVRLGSITPLTDDILPEDDLWLGVTVGDDPEMSPRQLLGDALRAVEAETAHYLDASGPIEMNGYGFDHPGVLDYTYPIRLLKPIPVGNKVNMIAAGGSVVGLNPDSYYGYQAKMQAHVVNYDDYELKLIVGVSYHTVGSVLSSSLESTTETNPPTGHEARVYLGGDEEFFWDPDYRPYEPGGFTVYANGDTYLDGALSGGAIIENNLQTPDELAADRIERFSQGDVLCYQEGRLELCTQAKTPRVQAVADKFGKPIVLGAEPIKVIGPVQEGDFLVASDVPGYTMADDSPDIGTVIAQALEGLDDEQGLIKAMIRKY